MATAGGHDENREKDNGVSNPLDPISGDITLCLVVHNRFGNLANALHSMTRLTTEIVVVDAGDAGGQTVRHLSSEYDAQYYQVPANPDESVLLNTALTKVSTPWALFLNQQEVFHAAEPQIILDRLKDTSAISFDFPIIRFNEPSNHHFETRLIRTDRGFYWTHVIFPSLMVSSDQAGEGNQLKWPVNFITGAAIVSLGDPELEEWALRDALVRIEQELDRDPDSVRYWYHLAETATRLKEWDRAHSAVEAGLGVLGKKSDASGYEPWSVNGLLGMFCEDLLIGNYYPEKTIDSLWTIYNHMESDGRFSVPLGQLLLAINREEDATAAQHKALDTFFNERQYYISLEKGLFKPALLVWKTESQHSNERLLRSVIEIQDKLKRRQYKLQAVLEYVYKHNQPLFFTIQTILQERLKRPE